MTNYLAKTLLFFSLILSLVLYFKAPTSFDMPFVICCTIIYITSSALLILNNCRASLVRFEFFFLIVFFFTNYSYPLIHYTNNPYFSLFNLEFNEGYICRAIALSTVGACAFNTGIYDSTSHIEKLTPHSTMSASIKKPGIIIYVLFVLFLPQIIRLYRLNEYSTEFESSYINVILLYLIYYYLLSKFYLLQNKSLRTVLKVCLKDPVFYLVFIYIFLFLGIGSRTIPLRIVLLSLFLFNFFVKKINNTQIILITIVGAVVLAIVGITRSGASLDEGSLKTIWDIGSDLTINNRSLYVLMEYVDENGLTYGRTMLMGVLSAIPYLQSIFLMLTGMDSDVISSGGLVTSLQFDKGDPNRIGLGTNLIGDIYVSFGLIGVVLLMYLLGKFLRKMNRGCHKGDILCVIIYSMIFIDSVYLSRSSFLACVRSVTWVLVIYYLYNKFLFKSSRRVEDINKYYSDYQ